MLEETLHDQPMPETETSEGTLFEQPVPQDAGPEDEIASLKRRAETEDFAALELAYRYSMGDGVERDWDESLKWYAKSDASMARYASGLMYSKLKNYSQAERELLSAVDAPDDDALALCELLLGELYLHGQTSTGEPDYEKAVQYLEQGLDLEPTRGKEYAGLLGQAYEAEKMWFDAIHWYRIAIEDFGRDEYKEQLYPLYRTGIAGAAKKREAEEAGE